MSLMSLTSLRSLLLPLHPPGVGAAACEPPSRCVEMRRLGSSRKQQRQRPEDAEATATTATTSTTSTTSTTAIPIHTITYRLDWSDEHAAETLNQLLCERVVRSAATRLCVQAAPSLRRLHSRVCGSLATHLPRDWSSLAFIAAATSRRRYCDSSRGCRMPLASCA